MLPRNLSRDRQTQPIASFCLAAGWIHAIEAVKKVIHMFLGDMNSVIVNG